MTRQTEMEMAHQHPSGAIGILDVQTLGAWVRFSAVIEERETPHGLQPMVVQLDARSDEGEIVPIGISQHATITMRFLQTYYRWRRQDGRRAS